MSFDEYVQQLNPIKRPRVDIKKEDCHVIYNVVGGKEVGLIMLRQHYVYFIPEGDTQLWTMDHQGNKKHRTVFFLNS